MSIFCQPKNKVLNGRMIDSCTFCTIVLHHLMIVHFRILLNGVYFSSFCSRTCKKKINLWYSSKIKLYASYALSGKILIFFISGNHIYEYITNIFLFLDYIGKHTRILHLDNSCNIQELFSWVFPRIICTLNIAQNSQSKRCCYT